MLEILVWIFTSFNSGMPEGFTLLTDSSYELRCGVTVMNERMAITANHCLFSHSDFRVVTSEGKSIKASIISKEGDRDIAFLLLEEPIYLVEYASFSKPDPTKEARGYGMCGKHLPGEAYTLWWAGFLLWNGYVFDIWESDLGVCQGDSGGLVVQEGKIVGIVQAKLFHNFVLSSAVK